MTTNADDDTPDASPDQPVQPQATGVSGHRRFSEIHFERMGQQVRAIYVTFYARHMREVQHKSVSWPRHNPLWDGGVYRGRQFDSIWPDIARSIYRLQLPYFEFVRQTFRMCSRTPPPPAALLTDIGAAQLRQEIDRLKSEYTLKLESEIYAHKQVCQMAAIGLAGHGIGEPLFQIDHENRSDLFLYCKAVAAGVQLHIKDYRHSAFVQYRQCPTAYRRAWASVLPKGIHQQALTEFGVELAASGLSSDVDQHGKE